MKKFYVSLLVLALPLLVAFQAPISVPNGTGAQVRSNMNNAFQAVTTQQSGSVAPSTMYSYQTWVDTGTIPAIFKIRNGVNTNWINLGSLSDGTNYFIANDADKVDGKHYIDIINTIYPVNSIYISTSPTNPATLFGVGTWVSFGAGRMLLGDGGGYTAGTTGGSSTKTLSVNEMPNHGHTAWTDTQGAHAHNYTRPVGGVVSAGGGYAGDHVNAVTDTQGAHGHNVGVSNTGGGQAFNIMNPYIVVYMWQRTN